MVGVDEYSDPRLVELYHLENPRGPDADFYTALAAELGAKRIIDLGCGTGLLTRELATPGRELTGIDPSPAMLAFARRQPGAERVQWVQGDASVLGRPEADLLVMTGNVAQVFLDDGEWLSALGTIHAALHPGGRLAFESRNPADRAWERWNRAATFSTFDPPGGRMESWVELTGVGAGRVSFEAHNVFLSTGEHIIVRSELRFRTLEEFTRTLKDSGFTIERAYGDWSRAPLLPASRIMIFVARRD
jgi:SAM-dependent methyltransferase